MLRGNDLEKLESLLPYAREFVEDLENLTQYPQSDQLQEISVSLNKLVESRIIRHDYWSQLMRIDIRMQELLESFEILKNVRNIIMHRFNEIDHEEYMRILNDLYEYGRDIDRMIEQAIAIIEEER
jgi:hypothetical protein